MERRAERRIEFFRNEWKKFNQSKKEQQNNYRKQINNLKISVHEIPVF